MDIKQLILFIERYDTNMTCIEVIIPIISPLGQITQKIAREGGGGVPVS